MSQSAAIRRLKKEYSQLTKKPPPGCCVRPLETNFLHAHFLLGYNDDDGIFYDTPYEGGIYYGVLQFPTNYPMAPPSVIMRTPSGRFAVNQKICFSMSDFHPELWHPGWSIGTILIGLVSFMNSEEITTGGVSASNHYRVDMAKQSLEHCMEKDKLAMELFKEELKAVHQYRHSNNNRQGVESWPPKRPATHEKKSTTSQIIASQTKKNTTKPVSQNKKETSSNNDTVTNTTSATTTTTGKNAARNKKKRMKEKQKKLAKKFHSTLQQQVPIFMTNILKHSLFCNKKEKENNIQSLYADHVCWRTETIEEYTELVEALKKESTSSSSNNGGGEFTLLNESLIGGRSIATFQLKQGIPIPAYLNNNNNKNNVIDVVEIPAPKESSSSEYKTGLEHVEFVIGNNENENDIVNNTSPVNNEIHQKILNEFMNQYPDIPWDTKALQKDINPDISFKFELQSSSQNENDDETPSTLSLFENKICCVKFHIVPLAKVIQYELEQQKEL